MPFVLAALAGCLPAPLLADASVGFEIEPRAELPAYLQCVPYARQLSGIQIYGDAHTWWGQASGRYERGNTPRVGAVMAFMPARNMTLGHVATVSQVIDQRTVLLDHANWSPINGRRGQIERDVKAVDVSAANDWSEVRVWYDPIDALGTTPWPVHGFIYGGKAKIARPQIARAPVGSQPVSATPSRQFASAFAGLGTNPSARPLRTRSQPIQPNTVRRMAQDKAAAPSQRSRSRDAIGAALARYD